MNVYTCTYIGTSTVSNRGLFEIEACDEQHAAALAEQKGYSLACTPQLYAIDITIEELRQRGVPVCSPPD